MPRVLYTSPHMQRTVDPDEALLRQALFEQPWEEWWHSPNNSAALQVILDDDEEGDCSVEGQLSTGTFYRVSREYPSLVIFQPEPDEFLIECFKRGAELVPLVGDSLSEFAVYHSGGEQYRIPRACLIGPEHAFRIVLEFMQSYSCADEFKWTSLLELPVPDEFWDPL